jgi:hypothetical protein
MNRISPPTHESIRFLTTHHPYTVESAVAEGRYSPDITIKFYPTENYDPDCPDYNEDSIPKWERHWAIQIHNSDLHTNDMSKALKKLAGSSTSEVARSQSAPPTTLAL